MLISVRLFHINKFCFSTILVEKAKEDQSVLNVKRIWKILKIPKVAYLLAIKCICGIPFGIFQSMFSIVAMEYFKLGPKENGIVLSYVGILSIVSICLEYSLFHLLQDRLFSIVFLLVGLKCPCSWY